MGSMFQTKAVCPGLSFEDQGFGETVVFQALHTNQDLPCQYITSRLDYHIECVLNSCWYF